MKNRFWSCDMAQGQRHCSKNCASTTWGTCSGFDTTLPSAWFFSVFVWDSMLFPCLFAATSVSAAMCKTQDLQIWVGSNAEAASCKKVLPLRLYVRWGEVKNTQSVLMCFCLIFAALESCALCLWTLVKEFTLFQDEPNEFDGDEGIGAFTLHGSTFCVQTMWISLPGTFPVYLNLFN